MRTPFLSLYLLSRSLMTFGVTVAARTSACSQACTLIQAALPGKVFYPGPCPSLPQGPHIPTYQYRWRQVRKHTWRISRTPNHPRNRTQHALSTHLLLMIFRQSCVVSSALSKDLIILNVFQIKIIGRDDIRAPFAVSRQFTISS
jgi:hypothetical protein